MDIRKIAGCLFAIITISGISFGDGRFYHLEKVPVGIPYQRALLVYEDNKETLILQSKYKTIDSDSNAIGWVVPVPNVPELASMDADLAHSMFVVRMDFRSQPHDIGLRYYSGYIGLILLVSLVIGWPLKKYGVKWWRVAIVVLMVSLLFAFIFMPALGKGGPSHLEIIKAESVGIYDVKVIKSDDANAIIQWLRDNQYQYEQKDLNVFQNYIKKEWCFVTAKVNKTKNMEHGSSVYQGLAAPLILRFDSNEPVYPMALTANAGTETEVLLYLISDYKMHCDGKLELQFYGGISHPFRNAEDYKDVQPRGFFKNSDNYNCNMSKFKGRFKPDQMKEDIIFKRAGDEKPYRKTIWW